MEGLKKLACLYSFLCYMTPLSVFLFLVFFVCLKAHTHMPTFVESALESVLELAIFSSVGMS